MKALKVSPGPGGKTTIITVEASREDAQRFLEALEAGKFSDLGIVSGSKENEGTERSLWSERQLPASKAPEKSGR